MKKHAPKKLAVNRETIRALDDLLLARVAGAVDTGINCPLQPPTPLVFSGVAMCTDQAAPKPPGG